MSCQKHRETETDTEARTSEEAPSVAALQKQVEELTRKWERAVQHGTEMESLYHREMARAEKMTECRDIALAGQEEMLSRNRELLGKMLAVEDVLRDVQKCARFILGHSAFEHGSSEYEYATEVAKRAAAALGVPSEHGSIGDTVGVEGDDGVAYTVPAPVARKVVHATNLAWEMVRYLDDNVPPSTFAPGPGRDDKRTEE